MCNAFGVLCRLAPPYLAQGQTAKGCTAYSYTSSLRDRTLLPSSMEIVPQEIPFTENDKKKHVRMLQFFMETCFEKLCSFNRSHTTFYTQIVFIDHGTSKWHG